MKLLALFVSLHFILCSLYSNEQPPCAVVIFGATGDLTARKLLPAIYNLAQKGNLSEDLIIVGASRNAYTHEEFRALMQKAVSTYSKTKSIDIDFWKKFESKIFYQQVNFGEDVGYENLHSLLTQLNGQYETKGNRLYYLATPPSYFTTIIERLSKHCLVYKSTEACNSWSRVVIEKPFGRDLESAIELQNLISQHLDESQIFRIDHYLGKEGVQNLITFRFANAFVEPIWNRQYIDNIQITISEDIGIGSRAQFWEETGYLRDIVQNHLMQLLALVTMEQPNNLSSESIHLAKINALNAIRPISSHEVDQMVVRGQYGPGSIHGSLVPGYLQEEGVPPQSTVETYLAAKLFIDNERWTGVPFYIRGGKRMPYQTAEIVVTLKRAPLANLTTPNAIVIRIQPNPGIFLRALCKVPGTSNELQPLIFGYLPESLFNKSAPEAYEKLLYDCLNGDRCHFVQGEEQIAAWRILTPILNHWKDSSPDIIPTYPSGTWGPAEADRILMKDCHQWLLLD